MGFILIENGGINELSHFIQNTLSGLKQLLNNNDQMKSVAEEGEVYTVSCSFNPPIKISEIETFESEHDIKLPEDYKAFLKLHNGARIYESVDDDGVNIGGGLHLFSLDDIKETQEVEYISEHGIPIAHLLEDCYLILDIEKLKSTDPNYLNILEFTDIKILNLNFEIFLDRYIISQGVPFWSWPIYTAENYYRTR
ncbi:SMI1/KNR4 family protein [Peribacillus frigoritolerans]|uniref:SMI1/KNR4 family protein n=1 Tax=Peribacillus frigoritolerans TaxID=450367 RepID=UPI002E22AEF7|nr:SMI1/KNR4 family protein [Peribacillus frigoritolerans]MED3847467.1 SMI1/KNR4 family protein [Peribacillus frigoritolerans]